MKTKRRNISFSELVQHPASTSLSHHKRALSLTIGFYLGLFPVWGCTTVLCLLTSFTFRLNTFLVVGMNLLVAPVQLLLMLPLIKYGQLLFFNNSGPYSAITLRNFYKTELSDTFIMFLENVAGGMLLWAFLSTLTAFFVYRLFIQCSKMLLRD